MIRNFSFDVFVISYMFGYFKKIPSWILLLIIIAAVLDAIALYFSGVDVSVYNKNPTLKKVIDIPRATTSKQTKVRNKEILKPKRIKTLLKHYFSIFFLQLHSRVANLSQKFSSPRKAII